MLLGSHVGMSGKEMFAGSVKEAISYGANTFMVYTGAPQNTRRKSVDELNIPAAKQLMEANGINEFVIHAPYIINLGNSVNADTYKLSVDFLAIELERTAAMGSHTLVLHPGAHVGAGADLGIDKIVAGINSVLTADSPVNIALETMAGKGSEIGKSFEELARIYDGVVHNDKLRVCFDTCHVNDAGYDIVNDLDGVLEHFDAIIGKEQIAVFHINDSKNERGAGKDRHENIGFGTIGFDGLLRVINHPDFENVPKIMETPYIPNALDKKKSYPPYKYEIAMIKSGVFNPEIKNEILADNCK
ncbi:MAG: deoxyribonuclease IV [Lachnospiraceae bacterium]|nr:deoxyribonuclease IV [Lachnospiraceae bacterium]